VTTHQCQKPSIVVMDYINGTRMVNRMCTTCGQHWHGPDGDVKEYTRAEWEKWVNSKAEDE